MGVAVGNRAAYFLSIAVRICATVAPLLCICIASRATSIQIAHPKPCESHAVTWPLAVRDFTKQLSFPVWPLRSQPQ